MLTFFGIVNVGVAMVCAVFYYFLYAVTFNTELLFDVHIHGKDCKDKVFEVMKRKYLYVRSSWLSGWSLCSSETSHA